jgi:hypothetical protein
VTGMPADTAAAIEAITREVQRLTPSWERPETFHERKAEIIGFLRALARSPLVTRRVVQFATAPTPLFPPRRSPYTPGRVPPAANLPASPPVGQRALARPRRTARRHRYPLPGRRVAGQTTLGLESL